MPSRALLASVVVVWALAQAGCGAGEGGTITVPCEAARCNETCLADGAESGSCRETRPGEETCVCRPRLDIPGGPTLGLSSGGVVERRSGGYQLELTVGPVAPAAQGSAGSREVELGIQPQTDPERVARP